MCSNRRAERLGRAAPALVARDDLLDVAEARAFSGSCTGRKCWRHCSNDGSLRAQPRRPARAPRPSARVRGLRAATRGIRRASCRRGGRARTPPRPRPLDRVGEHRVADLGSERRGAGMSEQGRVPGRRAGARGPANTSSQVRQVSVKPWRQTIASSSTPAMRGRERRVEGTPGAPG